MAEEKPTYEELVEMVVDLVRETAISKETPVEVLYDDACYDLEGAFDLLERLGRLEYVDSRWARIK